MDDRSLAGHVDLRVTIDVSSIPPPSTRGGFR